ncbi:putative toxin-antitoxin system antitoxin component (TIGR02293 family) [Rhizobium mongolense]|uniref:Putative toxin-antitoxin system antitoxin component (TIGR02293 family) n=1 Tax=Rhizobium mongolense TaxID=57676 RepID=A0A7W6RPW4_9HYPH|nr:putative toxin-antitoxin system antitoxin component (TIGR02293 family) [Rhizobium mongolense]
MAPAHLLAPNDSQFKYRFVPKATYERRKASLRLSSNERMRIARVARAWNLALDVWQSEEAAREFLFRAHPMLEDRRPIDVIIQNEIGAELVLEILEIRQCCVTAQVLDRTLSSFRVGDPNGAYRDAGDRK